MADAKLDMELGDIIKSKNKRGGNGGQNNNKGRDLRGRLSGTGQGGRRNNNNNNNNNNRGGNNNNNNNNNRGGGDDRRKGGGMQRRGRGSRSSSNNNNDASAPYTKGNPELDWKHDLYENDGKGGNNKRGPTRQRGVQNARQSQRVQEIGRKLVVSNLSYDVSDKDIEELFASVGPIDRAKIKYDASGRSLGEAIVVYKNKEDVARAIEEYDGASLDGAAMKIDIAKPQMKKKISGSFTVSQNSSGDRVITRRNQN